MTDDPRNKRAPTPASPTPRQGARAGAPPPPRQTGADGDDNENDRPTVNPPFDLEAFARSESGLKIPRDPAVPEPEEEGARSKQITLTNEIELERARVQSVARTEPPRNLTPSALSIADARAKSSPSMPQLPAVSAPAPAQAAPGAHGSPGAGGAGGATSGPTTSSSIEAAVLDAIGGSQPPPEITERTIDDPLAEMRERFSLGDYTGALEMAELILAEEPGNLEAAECGESCRRVLEGMYAARLGALTRVPMVVVPRTQMRWLSIDHRAGFILSLVDGSSSVEMILDVCGMPKLDALRILHELVLQKIVAFR